MVGRSGVGNRGHRLTFALLVPVIIAVVLSAPVDPRGPSHSVPDADPGDPEIRYVPAQGLPPTAVVTPSRGEILVGERLVLSGDRSYDADGEIVGYLWSFAEGSGIEGPQITVQFSAPGTKTVSLTVTDDRGMRAIAWSSIDVMEPPPRQTILLTAGPVNVFEIASGADAEIELRLAVFGQRATGLRLTVVDDGGLEVESSELPWSLGPSETAAVRIRVHAPAELDAPVGATVQVVVQSDQGSSNVERLEFTLPAEPPPSGIPWEFLETTALVALAAVMCVVLDRRRRH